MSAPASAAVTAKPTRRIVSRVARGIFVSLIFGAPVRSCWAAMRAYHDLGDRPWVHPAADLPALVDAAEHRVAGRDAGQFDPRLDSFYRLNILRARLGHLWLARTRLGLANVTSMVFAVMRSTPSSVPCCSRSRVTSSERRSANT